MASRLLRILRSMLLWTGIGLLCLIPSYSNINTSDVAALLHQLSPLFSFAGACCGIQLATLTFHDAADTHKVREIVTPSNIARITALVCCEAVLIAAIVTIVLAAIGDFP